MTLDNTDMGHAEEAGFAQDVAEALAELMGTGSRQALLDLVNRLAAKKTGEILTGPLGRILAPHLDRLAEDTAYRQVTELLSAGGLGTPALQFDTVQDFAEQYFFKLYMREVIVRDEHRWCPKWWDHPEALVRMESIWRTWEHYRLQGPTGISLWLTNHADPHMQRMMDPEGPFIYCHARKGHLSQGNSVLRPLPHLPAPLGWLDEIGAEEMAAAHAGRDDGGLG
ncbi:DUF4913 domain-containing protein [Nocardia takedensis]|uniref:DUF4913 domain-containing protein n=1 Tax=Nocardia takedensis TaxID=259390 RepID=UPI003F77171B